MTTQDLVHKWLVYALGLVPIWLLDAFVLNRYTPFGVAPTLIPLAVVAVAVLEGMHAGTGFGLGAGLLWEACVPGGTGIRIIGMALAGMCAGAVARYGLSQSFLGCFLCSLGVLGVMEGVQVAVGLFTLLSQPGPLLSTAGAELAWSLVFTPLIYLVFRLIYNKVGGDTLA